MDVVFKFVIDVVWPFIKPNKVVEVAFKLLIENVELVDLLFKLLNVVFDFAVKSFEKLFKLLIIVVHVAFKLLIDNVECADKLFKFVVNANTPCR